MKAGLPQIRERFRRFGAEHAAGEHGSPLYQRLCIGLAEDPETCSLLLEAAPTQRIPNLLFAAVHDLLLAGGDAAADPLAAYYRSVIGPRALPPDAGAPAAFAAFCRRFRPAVVERIRTRSTQTNEPRRAAALVPAMGLVAAEAGSPLALLEAGTSAGLLLQADRFRIRYGARLTGPMDGPLTLACRVVGPHLPPLPAQLPVAWRAGIDLAPLDVNDEADLRWLRACLWPEHEERARHLGAALAIARHNPPAVLRGDMVDDLASVARKAPRAVALVVFHATVMPYLDARHRRAFVEAVRDVASRERRPVWLISFEAVDLVARLGTATGRDLLRGLPPRHPDRRACAVVAWRFDPDGKEHHRLLALAHPHGRWIEWLADAAD